MGLKENLVRLWIFCWHLRGVGVNCRSLPSAPTDFLARKSGSAPIGMTKLRAVAHLGMSGDGWTESKKRIWTRLSGLKRLRKNSALRRKAIPQGLRVVVFSICYGTLGNTNFNPLQRLSRGIALCGSDSQKAMLNGRLAWYGATSEVVT